MSWHRVKPWAMAGLLLFVIYAMTRPKAAASLATSVFDGIFNAIDKLFVFLGALG